MRIALMGTRGVPAHYGGFETCVEEVGSRLADRGHEVVVFCRPDYDSEDHVDSPVRYRGMELVQLPIVRRRALETLCHTALSVLHRSLRHTDAAIMFNAANAPLLPVLHARRIPVATHVDGLEWLRAKWGALGRRYYRAAESLSVRWSDAIICDARGIADYYRAEFGVDSELIAYGAPIVAPDHPGRIEELELSPGKYHLVVARFEPENHVLEIVQGYRESRAELPLVVVGAAPYADGYTAKIRRAADSRVRLLGSIWDQQQLDQLYAHSLTYLHGHCVGGTNPSLLRAAGAGAFAIAYDVTYNREVLRESAAYFRTPADVAHHVERAEADPAAASGIGADLREEIARYNWEEVTTAYERLCEALRKSRNVAM